MITAENWRSEIAVHVYVPIHSVTELSICGIHCLNQWLRLRHWTFSRVALTMLADIYVSQPMNDTLYSSISDQSTGLLCLLPRTVTLMMKLCMGLPSNSTPKSSPRSQPKPQQRNCFDILHFGQFWSGQTMRYWKHLAAQASAISRMSKGL